MVELLTVGRIRVGFEPLFFVDLFDTGDGDDDGHVAMDTQVVTDSDSGLGPSVGPTHFNCLSSAASPEASTVINVPHGRYAE